MIKNSRALFLIFCLILLCFGCSNNEKKIILDIADKQGNFTERLEILDKEKVSTAENVLKDVKWEEENEESYGVLKYRLSFAYIDSEKEVKASYYLVYLNPSDQLIFVEEDVKSAILSKEETKKIFDILSVK